MPDEQIIVRGYFDADQPGHVRASGGGTANFLRADGTWAAPSSGGEVADGDKGDLTVSSGGTVWTIDAGVVSTVKLGGDITPAGKALLDDGDNVAQRATLGLGTAATQSSSAFDPAGTGAAQAAGVQGNLTAHIGTTVVHGISAFGATLVDDTTAAAARTTLELAAVASSGSASDLGTGTLPIARIADGSITGAKILDGTITSAELGEDSVISAKIANANVTNGKLGDMPAQTLKGNNTNGTGSPLDLSVVQVKSMLGVSTAFAISVVKKTDDTTFNSATPADVPQGASGAPAMAFVVAAGVTYHFRFVCAVRSDTLTVGVAMSVTFPAVTVFAASGRFAGNSVDGVDAEWVGNITTSDDAVAAGNTVAINTDFVFVVEGVIVPSAPGTLVLRARTETTPAVVTVRQGSIGMLWTFT